MATANSVRENCYKFSVILIDIGNIIAQNFVQHVIKILGFPDINSFLIFHNSYIIQSNNSYLDSVKRAIKIPCTIRNFDITACAAIIQNIINTPYNARSSLLIPPDIQASYYFLYKLRELRNENFGHITCFEMRSDKFKNLLDNEISIIFFNLTKAIGSTFDFDNEIKKVLNEVAVEERMLKHFDKVLEDFKSSNLTQIKDFMSELKTKMNATQKI